MTTDNSFQTAARRLTPAIAGVALFSALLNILALTGAVYMLQLYDRVLPSRSVETLIGLSLIVLVLYAAYGALDLIRTRLLARSALRLDRTLRDRIFGLVMRLTSTAPAGFDARQPVRDLDQIKGFLASPGPTALLDMPWMPLFIAFVWLLHPWLGLLAGCGALSLLLLTLVTEWRTRSPAGDAAASTSQRQLFLARTEATAETIHAMGMGRRMAARWQQLSEANLGDHLKSANVSSLYGSSSKVLRLLLQSAVLGLGAYLTIKGEITAGVMIAASIITARALAPVEIAIGHWKHFVAARQGLSRLRRLLAAFPPRSDVMALPPPAGKLEVEALWAGAPGMHSPFIQQVSFALKAGDGLAIIGPTASGKSTLARALVGAWPAQRGSIRIDGASADQWDEEELGRHIGYLPQDVALHDGTIRDNITRYDPQATSEAVIAAARLAGIHEMILRLPAGYETQIGPGGQMLAAGQRQRVALARALYGDPFLVVLDEPNSNLDGDGCRALSLAIKTVRERGGIVVVVAHRTSVTEHLNLAMALNEGQVRAFGPRDEVLRRVVPKPQPQVSLAGSTGRLKVVIEGDGAGIAGGSP